MKIDIDIKGVISDLINGVIEARDKDVFCIDLPVDTATDAIRILNTLVKKEDHEISSNENVSEEVQNSDNVGEKKKTSFLCSGDGKEICNTCKNYIYNGSKEEDPEEGEQLDDSSMSFEQFRILNNLNCFGEYLEDCDKCDKKDICKRWSEAHEMLKGTIV